MVALLGGGGSGAAGKVAAAAAMVAIEAACAAASARLTINLLGFDFHQLTPPVGDAVDDGAPNSGPLPEEVLEALGVAWGAVKGPPCELRVRCRCRTRHRMRTGADGRAGRAALTRGRRLPGG